MRRSLGILLAAVVAGLIAVAVPAASDSTPAVDDPRPNVVVIMTDDQTYADMAAMPLTRRLIGDAGTTFTDAYVSYPLCCPSRATFLTGRYAHNHGVRSTTPPHGGYEALDAENALPVWLRDAGYDTIHIGKYLNGYGLRRKPGVPPGWTDWQGTVDRSTYQMYGYKIHENGTTMTYGDFDVEDSALYQTDVLRDKALTAIGERAGRGRPFFLSLNFVAPHGESSAPGRTTTPYVRPAARHVGRFSRLPLPRRMRPEANVDDKPPHVRALKSSSGFQANRILDDFRSRRESLLAVDEAVASVVSVLAATGELDSTYILFTSDNGFFQGEHRIPKGKYLAYDAASHVPLLMRGPGIPQGQFSEELVANTDLAPTILEITGATPTNSIDGRSLLPYARDWSLRSLRPVLHEGLVAGSTDRDGPAEKGGSVGVYYAVRTPQYLYIRWRGGARELYDLERDPLELRSRHDDPEYADVMDAMSDEVVRLRNCSGADCLEPFSP